jgi:hypothetical protein
MTGYFHPHGGESELLQPSMHPTRYLLREPLHLDLSTSMVRWKKHHRASLELHIHRVEQASHQTTAIVEWQTMSMHEVHAVGLIVGHQHQLLTERTNLVIRGDEFVQQLQLVRIEIPVMSHRYSVTQFLILE